MFFFSHRLRGLKAVTLGASFFVALFALLQLSHDWVASLGESGQCTAGPFDQSPWEFILPTLSMLWLGSIAIEAALPRTWRRQDGSSVFTRIVVSLAVWAAIATFGFVVANACS